jgi:hypothetical protein
MDTITISKEEYGRLKEIKKRFEAELFNKDALTPFSADDDVLDDDRVLMKLSEPSFSFWDNPDDAIYDNI